MVHNDFHCPQNLTLCYCISQYECIQRLSTSTASHDNEVTGRMLCCIFSICSGRWRRRMTAYNWDQRLNIGNRNFWLGDGCISHCCKRANAVLVSCRGASFLMLYAPVVTLNSGSSHITQFESFHTNGTSPLMNIVVYGFKPRRKFNIVQPHLLKSCSFVTHYFNLILLFTITQTDTTIH